ncbi:TetR/AcrR family transcriptional regulator [Dactylosporangium aurantiacum]|uniref:TetR/AcrR family transcriptional regulator n=1 Tax=Dactylosporangium aurantiacum TaxID=35754 RepID=A0A9Q9IF62_9ACTN|nr:TetR/AcrR family transcriptional regulator [Dactylosporangium aurantiacum]MDG6101930.1 TetR/AcrR family transcriptional regulator [Dactylosporangium aurantiacum]UWZ52279.1 TetR/AcrR family transcriptional regulator [Dactylosporangium aurantiacum]
MSEGVKRNRQPGTRRAEQARATRRRVIDHATTLFLSHGYSATTLDQIAKAAGISVQTLYFHFGNKATVLKEVVDVLAVGDDKPVPLLDRPWTQRLRDASDGPQALAIWVRNARTVFGRIAPIMKIVRDAAGSDPEMAAQWQTNMAQRYTAQRTVVQHLADRHFLGPDLTVDRAAGIVYCLISIEVYQLCTVDRGWSPAQWEQWIIDTLTSTILR